MNTIHFRYRALLAPLLILATIALLPTAGTAAAQDSQPSINDDPYGIAYSLEATQAGVAQLYDAPNGNLVVPTYTYPSGESIDYPQISPTYFGNTLVFPVASGEPGDEWAEVMLSTRPQGQTAWVPTADYEWRTHIHTIHVFLAERLLYLASDNYGLWEATVAIGREDRPTPVGRVAIDEIIPGPSPAYGPWILGVGLFSDALETFGGGLPKIGVQGTSTPDLLGQAISSGSIRMLNEDIEYLVIELGENIAGTPITFWPARADFTAAVEQSLAGSTRMCLGRQVTVDLSIPGQQPTSGQDVILGTPGVDVIAAGGGDDFICAGGGDDIVWGQTGNDTIDGGPGDDKLRGGPGDDVLGGGAGADDLNGSAGNDVVDGGPGDDHSIRGGTGDDSLTGGPGNDALVSGNGGEDTVLGNDGNDEVRGGPRKDALYGGNGNDTIYGNGGADQIFGGPGDDNLFGGRQPDVLDGGTGTNNCNGGLQVDLFAAGTCATIVNP